MADAPVTTPPASEQGAALAPVPLSGKMNAMEYGGAVLEFPVEWDDSRVGAALTKFRESPEFYDLIDKETGSDMRTRHAVGSAYSPEDRLTTIKKFYPDALPYDGDNFVYTHPKTGKLTLHNPEGLDYGDVAGSAREIFIGAGSTLVAAFGAAGGVTIGAPTGPGAALTAAGGAVWGAGLGASATKTMYDFLAEQVMGVANTQSIAERTISTATEGLGAASGERLGQVALPALTSGVKKALGGGSAKSKAIYDSLKSFDITPTAGSVTGGRGVGRVEGALDQAAPSTSIMRDTIEKVINDSKAAAQKIAAKVGMPGSQQRTGEIIRTAAEKATARYKETQEILETRLEGMIGENTIIPIESLKALRESFEAKVLQAPNSLGPKYRSIIEEIKLIEADALDAGGLPYSVFREHRSALGQKMSDFQEKTAKKTLWKMLYGNMTKDLEDVVQTFGSDTIKQFDETIAFTRNWNQNNAALLEKLVDLDAPEKAFRYVMNTRKDGGTILRKLQNEFSKDEWDDISSTVIQKMGYKNFGNEADDAFSIATFLTNYKSIADEAKESLFRGANSAVRKELDGLVGVFDELQKNSRMGNFSNTAGAAHLLDTLATLGFDTTSLAAGAVTGKAKSQAATSLVGNIVGRVLMPRQVAKLITNPNFVKWLATPVTRTDGVGAHIGRLAAVAKANPEIQSEIHDFLQALSSDEGSNQ